MKCPRCGSECERDEVDVGVGSMPSGPWGCFDCGWVDAPDTLELVEPGAATGKEERPEGKDGISAQCWYCAAPGYLYRHSGGYNISMCDKCRDGAATGPQQEPPQ